MIKEEIKSFKGYWLNEGKEEGIEQGIELVAKKLLEDGAEISYVSKITNLSIEVLKKLSKEIK